MYVLYILFRVNNATTQTPSDVQVLYVSQIIKFALAKPIAGRFATIRSFSINRKDYVVQEQLASHL